MVMPRYKSIIAMHAFPKILIYLTMKMWDFEAKYENAFAGFISIPDNMYGGWIVHYQGGEGLICALARIFI